MVHGTGRSQHLAVAILLFLVAGVASAADVEEVQWGFGGRVVPERINILSVLLRNNTGENFQGQAVLTRDDGVGNVRGARLVADVFLGPFTSRWVQFYPYVPAMGERWTLEVGKAAATDLPEPRTGAPALVYLADPRSALALSPPIAAMPDDVFPPTVAATDGLGAVVLDHVPRWETARRRAFIDWLRLGGTVHLLPDQGGIFPSFAGELAPLGEQSASFRVGAGTVVRHEVALEAVTPRYLAARGFPAAGLSEGDRHVWGVFDGVILLRLAGIVQPDHNWGAIYLVLVGYLVCVGLANWLIGRKSRGFILPTGFFLASVGLTSALFSLVGRSGFDVGDAIHTVSYARQIEGGAYDVTQWSNAFARRGDYYKITHPGGLGLYSTCQTVEAVRGLISAGAGGSFTVDIPVCSSRGFLHRGRMEGPDLGLRVARWQGSGDSLRLEIETAAGFAGTVVRAWAVTSGGICPLLARDGLLITGGNSPADREQFFSRQRGDMFGDGYYGYGPYGQVQRQEARTAFRSCAVPLLARATGGTEDFRYYVPDSGPGPDAVDVFVYAPSPPGFYASETGLGDETGYVLYHVRLFRGESDHG